MKATRIIAITATLVIICGGFYIYANASNTQEVATEQSGVTTDNTSGKALPVTVTTVSPDSLSWTELIGTVKANDQIKVFATSSGQLQQALVSDGSQVKTGDPLFYIGGVNGNKPSALIQLESAQAAYDNAVNGLNLTLKGNDISIKSAELQLESAKHLAKGSERDLQVMNENLSALDTALFFLNDSYNASNTKNDVDVEKVKDGINELSNGIQDLERQKRNIINDLNDNPADSEALYSQLDEINAQLDDLYKQLDEARKGYTQLMSGLNAGNNQLLGQIAQTKTQSQALYLTKLGTESKLGMTSEGITDQVKLAAEGLSAAKLKNEASVLQSKSQIDMAAASLELAKLQADSLVVKSPISGTVGQILVNEGDLVGPQSMLTQVYGMQRFELDVAVNADIADSISINDQAEVMIGGKFIKVPIRNVSLSTDPATKLVNVTVALPNISLRGGQTLRVRLPVKVNNDGLSTSRFVPLDAVIIATEEQYVYVAENGKAIKKTVTTGQVLGDQIEILSGLGATDQVIVEGAKSLINGQNISLS